MRGYGAMREGRALLNRTLGGASPGDCESSGDEDLEGGIRRAVVARPEERPPSRSRGRRAVITLFLIGAVGLAVAAIATLSSSMATDAATMAQTPNQRASTLPTGDGSTGGSVDKGVPNTTEGGGEDSDESFAVASSGSTSDSATSSLADEFGALDSDSQERSVDIWTGDASDELDGSWLDGSTESTESDVYGNGFDESMADSTSGSLFDWLSVEDSNTASFGLDSAASA